MKRVIDGKVYNTETADEIASDSYGHGNDFHAWNETLHKTKKGAYFVHGSGGARSRWREQVSQNTWSGGEGIEALTKAEALAWCERHNINADVIAEHFEVEDA